MLASKPSQVIAGLRWRYGVVVTQCCTIEQRGVLQVAAVQEMRQPEPDRDAYEALRATWPPREGQPYHGYLHALDDHPDLQARAEGRMFVVDLTRQVFIAGQDEVAVLASRMVGRMTPESRRHLRNRLMFFYGRTEATDAEQLDGMGSPFDR